MVTTPGSRRLPIRLIAIVTAAVLVTLTLASCDEKECGGTPTSGASPGSTSVGTRLASAGLLTPPDGSRPRPKPKPSKGKNPCPSKGGKDGKQGKDKKMFGANGPRIFSETLHNGHVRGYHYRIDIENPAPGRRAASLHVQLGGRGSTRYEYNPKTKNFIATNGARLPRRVEDHIDNDPVAQRRIKEGLRKLGEN